MRLMGNAAYGQKPNTVAVLTTAEAVKNYVENDPNMPIDADKTQQFKVPVEAPGKPNSELQQYIIGNTVDIGFSLFGKDSAAQPHIQALGAGLIPGPAGVPSPYSRSNMSPNANVQPDSAGLSNTIADLASGTSRAAGVVAAGATAVAAQAGPYGKPAQAVVAGATAIGAVADVAEQIARPNLQQVIIEQVGVGVPQEMLTRRYPLLAPVINESSELIKNKVNQQEERK